MGRCVWFSIKESTCNGIRPKMPPPSIDKMRIGCVDVIVMFWLKKKREGWLYGVTMVSSIVMVPVMVHMPHRRIRNQSNRMDMDFIYTGHINVYDGLGMGVMRIHACTMWLTTHWGIWDPNNEPGIDHWLILSHDNDDSKPRAKRPPLIKPLQMGTMEQCVSVSTTARVLLGNTWHVRAIVLDPCPPFLGLGRIHSAPE